MIDSEVAFAWATFLDGHWTREKPRRPGYYPVQGVGCGEVDGSTPSVLVIAYESEGEIRFTQSWGGWWWSEPLPLLPPTPDAARADHRERK